MSLSASPISATPIASAIAGGFSSGTGSLAPIAGIGTQGIVEFRGERFRATETRTRWRARESDSQEMLGTTDKSPLEKVRYEVDFLDILNGASITSYVFWITGSLLVYSHQLVSNGAQAHAVRALVGGGASGDALTLKYVVTCSDGAVRARTLKIRVRDL